MQKVNKNQRIMSTTSTIDGGGSDSEAVMVDCIIVGGGISGLACSRELQKAGIVSFKLLEASDRCGGRVQTDEMEGFLLDRGFQVFIENYPEAREIFDYEALRLKQFLPVG